jgi:hypothetical protein
MGDDFGHADESREESGRRGNTWVDIAPVCAIQRAAGGGGTGTRSCKVCMVQSETLDG